MPIRLRWIEAERGTLVCHIAKLTVILCAAFAEQTRYDWRLTMRNWRRHGWYLSIYASSLLDRQAVLRVRQLTSTCTSATSGQPRFKCLQRALMTTARKRWCLCKPTYSDVDDHVTWWSNSVTDIFSRANHSAHGAAGELSSLLKSGPANHDQSNRINNSLLGRFCALDAIRFWKWQQVSSLARRIPGTPNMDARSARGGGNGSVNLD
jgi:hypothetical protein